MIRILYRTHLVTSIYGGNLSLVHYILITIKIQKQNEEVIHTGLKVTVRKYAVPIGRYMGSTCDVVISYCCPHMVILQRNVV